jgi:hypothetical protein
MKLVTIEQHPFRSGVFDKFIGGMKVEAECRASIRGQITPTTSTCRRVRNTVIRAAIALNVGHEFRALQSIPALSAALSRYQET